MSDREEGLPFVRANHGALSETVNPLPIYRALERMKGGGTSNVYRVEVDQVPYAVKASPFYLDREARILSRLANPHILPVLASGEATLDTSAIPDDKNDGVVANTLRFRFVSNSLTSELDKLPPQVRRQILQQLLETLRYVHQAGIVHRDIKIDNVLLEQENSLLIDFGNAKEFELPAREKDFLPLQQQDLRNFAIMIRQVLASEPDINFQALDALMTAEDISIDQLEVVLRAI